MATLTDDLIQVRLGELRRQVYHIVLKFTRRVDADDVVQEAMLALWQILKEKPDAS